MENEKSLLVKLKDFLNDSDNEFLIRFIMIIGGTIFGTLLIIVSGVFNGSINVALQIFGYATFVLSWVAAALWYAN